MAYAAPAWNVGDSAYVNRSWCRMEMFYAANIPIQTEKAFEERLEKFDAGLKYALQVGRRPHLLYGTREDVGVNNNHTKYNYIV